MVHGGLSLFTSDRQGNMASQQRTPCGPDKGRRTFLTLIPDPTEDQKRPDKEDDVCNVSWADMSVWRTHRMS